ncbi:MAG: FAD-dependent oxidoreductase [Pseudomonadota bacterium]
MRIAVIGSGISGLGAAYALKDHHDVTLFEAEDRFGGHANTVDVAFGDRKIAVDTGFIVYNYRNYPNLTGLFDHLDVPTKWSDMSFGLSVRGGAVEYACDNLDQLFAQRRNALSPAHLRGLLQILRFNRTAPADLDAGRLDGLTLGAWLERERYGRWFRDCFVLPFGGAIWSTPTGEMLDFPAANFVSFFRNHDLMNGMKPMQRWRTVDGGSRHYVNRIVAALGPRAHSATPVAAVNRRLGQPEICFADGQRAVFDAVILACHGPQAMALLADRDAQEAGILGQFRTSQNSAVLHSDPALMPQRRKVWSSWNFLSEGGDADRARPAPVTYWMNRLQGIDRAYPLFVTLNPSRQIDPARIHATFTYAHPIFTPQAFAGQREIGAIQGRGGIWYAGAWLGYGFHEDGLRAGLRVAAALGARPDWAADMPAPAQTPLAEAAE